MKPTQSDPTRWLIEQLWSVKTPAMEWLERAGPIAARLNEESPRDGERANNASPRN